MIKIKNDELTPVGDIIGQMLDPRPLPLGRSQFEEWSDRIIAGACLTSVEETQEAFVKSQKYVLANAIMHLGPTESHKPDAHFIHMLRKVATNQVANAICQEFLAEKKAKIEQEKTELKLVENELS